MSYTYKEGTIIDIKNETQNVKRFTIKMPDDVNFSFKAGQFIMIDLPINHKYTNRAYSIASPPNDRKVMVSKPLGKFGLPQVIDRDICFICTGTGIAPLRSMLIDLLNRREEKKNIYMIFGTRYAKDILYYKDMKAIEQLYSEFKFIPVLSREENWMGEKGYVHNVYENIFSDGRPCYFYLCGWKDMLNEARERLTKMGYDKQSIKFESYD